jgi:PPOX class probable FMN-dependent enzyme
MPDETLWLPSLVLAIYQNRGAPDSRFVQMATIRADGRPANRTVIFRGFLDNSPRLTFVTDARSAKVAELESASWSELCWYFAVTHVQFRISGPTTIVRSDSGDAGLLESRRAAWRELAEAVRVSFTWPAPGAPREIHGPFPTIHPDQEIPPTHFCLLILDPQEVDILELHGNPQNRWTFCRTESDRWQGTEINP